jgi:hypothetical protein
MLDIYGGSCLSLLKIFIQRRATLLAKQIMLD